MQGRGYPHVLRPVTICRARREVHAHTNSHIEPDSPLLFRRHRSRNAPSVVHATTYDIAQYQVHVLHDLHSSSTTAFRARLRETAISRPRWRPKTTTTFNATINRLRTPAWPINNNSDTQYLYLEVYEYVCVFVPPTTQ